MLPQSHGEPSAFLERLTALNTASRSTVPLVYRNAILRKTKRNCSPSRGAPNAVPHLPPTARDIHRWRQQDSEVLMEAAARALGGCFSSAYIKHDYGAPSPSSAVLLFSLQYPARRDVA